MKDDIQSQGGLARAESLSPEERSEIAAKAAAARWNLPKATHEGDLPLGGHTLHCAVLEDGRRLLTQSDFMVALGRSRQAKGREYYDGDVNLPAFLTAKNLKPYIDSDLYVSSSQVVFKPLKGSKAFGYPAELLPLVCEVFLKARDAGDVLTHNQIHIAKQADILMRGLARVGIAALIDEATGYQEVRDRVALQKILDKYLTDEWAKWSRTFEPEFYRQLFRLKGIELRTDTTKKPSYVGHWTNDIVYSRLAPGVVEELRKKNPRSDLSGNRARKHHQHMTRDYGHPALKEHLSNVTFLMKTCATDNEFKRKLDVAAPKHGDTPQLPLGD